MNALLTKIKEYFSAKVIIELTGIILLLAISLYVISGNVIFSSSPTDPIPLGLFIGAICLGVVIFIGLITYNVIKSDYRPNIVLSIMLSVLFIIQLITILAFNNNIVYSMDLTIGTTYIFGYSLQAIDYVKSIFAFLMVLLICFIIIDFMPKVFKDYEPVIYLLIAIILLLNLVTIIYSFITEFDKIGSLFKMESFEELPDLALHSFYPSKNTFGIFLLCSMLGFCYIAIRKYHHVWLVLLVLLLIPIFLTQCKLAIGIALGLLIGFGIIRFLQTYKDNKQRNWIVLASIIGGVLLMGVILLSIPKTAEMIKGLVDNMFQEKWGHSTMDGREKIWSNSLLTMSYFNRFSGVGYKIFNGILLNFNNADEYYYFVTADTDSAHSTYLELLGNGGISFLLVWLLIYSYSIYLLVKQFKEDKWLVSFEILVLITITTLSVLEGGCIIFPQSAEYLFFTVFLFVPLLASKNKTTLRLFY